jgi:hypothetical protein
MPPRYAQHDLPPVSSLRVLDALLPCLCGGGYCCFENSLMGVVTLGTTRFCRKARANAASHI